MMDARMPKCYIFFIMVGAVGWVWLDPPAMATADMSELIYCSVETRL